MLVTRGGNELTMEIRRAKSQNPSEGKRKAPKLLVQEIEIIYCLIFAA